MIVEFLYKTPDRAKCCYPHSRYLLKNILHPKENIYFI